MPSTPHTPTPTPKVQYQAKTDAHEAQLPTDPDTDEPPPHSSVVWTKALDIAQTKLSENNLPRLDLTKLSPAEENIEAVLKSLNTLQEDQQKKRWSYTWHGKKIIIAERLGEIFRSMDKYSKIVGTAVQCDPHVSAIVWAGVQAIIQVCISFTTVILTFTHYTDSMSRSL